ncbi:MAG: hypothetical protein JW940_33480 [Polyangiaceae bacterium]|nr:hypothetical protein [Polyangiaceae bacterium]
MPCRPFDPWQALDGRGSSRGSCGALRRSVALCGTTGDNHVQRRVGQCGRTLCRLTFRHTNEDIRKRFVDSGFMSAGSWGGDQFGGLQEGEAGGVESFVHFSHEGDATPFREMRHRMLAYVQ